MKPNNLEATFPPSNPASEPPPPKPSLRRSPSFCTTRISCSSNNHGIFSALQCPDSNFLQTLGVLKLTQFMKIKMESSRNPLLNSCGQSCHYSPRSETGLGFALKMAKESECMVVGERFALRRTQPSCSLPLIFFLHPPSHSDPDLRGRGWDRVLVGGGGRWLVVGGGGSVMEFVGGGGCWGWGDEEEERMERKLEKKKKKKQKVQVGKLGMKMVD